MIIGCERRVTLLSGREWRQIWQGAAFRPDHLGREDPAKCPTKLMGEVGAMRNLPGVVIMFRMERRWNGLSPQRGPSKTNEAYRIRFSFFLRRFEYEDFHEIEQKRGDVR